MSEWKCATTARDVASMPKKFIGLTCFICISSNHNFSWSTLILTCILALSYTIPCNAHALHGLTFFNVIFGSMAMLIWNFGWIMQQGLCHLWHHNHKFLVESIN